MTAPDVLEVASGDDPATPRRVSPALATLVVVALLAAALAAYQVSQRPSGWVPQQTRYSTVQKVLVPITGNCVQVTLTGNLKYERSTAAKPGDRHFRHLLITEPAMEWLFYASCTKGADLVALRHIDAAQTFTTTDGRALARNAEKWAGLHRGVSQYNTGIPTRADGVTGRGKICVSVLPSLIARNGALEFMAPLHKATVCGH